MSLATAVPPHVITQAEAKDRARAAFGRKALFDRLSGVFDNAGIARRHIVAPQEWYGTSHGWRDRNTVYLEAAEDLFVEAASAAIDKAGLQPREIDGVVTVSTTGIATPSLDARAAHRVGFRENIRRVPVFGLGCAGGATGLSLAARLAAAEPGSTVLFVCVELCTLAFRVDEPGKADIVAAALFGDGAAACVLRAGEAGFAEVAATGEHTWPDTLDIMGWRVDPQGFGVIFAQAIPPFARRARSRT